MSVSNAVASGTLIIAISVAAAWGAFLSVRSAERGPRWAQHHLLLAARVGVGAALGGLIGAALVDPAWLGWGITYVALVVSWLAFTVRRSLLRAAEMGLDEPLPAQRRQVVLARSGRALLAAAATVAALALVDLAVRRWIALADFVLVAALAVPGWMARRSASEAR